MSAMCVDATWIQSGHGKSHGIYDGNGSSATVYYCIKDRPRYNEIHIDSWVDYECYLYGKRVTEDGRPYVNVHPDDYTELVNRPKRRATKKNVSTR